MKIKIEANCIGIILSAKLDKTILSNKIVITSISLPIAWVVIGTLH